MRGSSDDEREQLRQVVRQFLDSSSTESEVRRLMSTDEGFDREVWLRMARELGLQGLIVPEAFGGSGVTFTELAVVLEEMGRALICSPFLATTLATAALLFSEDADAQARYLPGIADGSSIATIGFPEVDGQQRDGTGGEIIARQDGGGWVLSGTVSHVLDGTIADIVLVTAPTSLGTSLFCVLASDPGFDTIPLTVLDPTRKQARIVLDGVPATLVGTEGGAETIIRQQMIFTASAVAVEQVGGARRCLQMAVDYARQRVQFGRTIGSFQAIKHKCADLLVEIESAAAAAKLAVQSVTEHSESAGLVASLAKAYCSDAYVHAAAENIQIHGGIGFTWEHPAHLYYRRAMSTRVIAGDPDSHRARAAELIGI
ncbi:acyl-CoA/acyl-ACP dehydrogenase [Nocardia sp. alder85J]|nr:acyl-CoA/acyl-ACP dehydrogenase [Nocardia sp. alder85J]